jgi:hypothetical protein
MLSPNMRWPVWWVWGCIVGCSGVGAQAPAPAPAYVPANSPEPETVCRKEAARAKKARVAAIGDESGMLREQAASAAFAQAECELRQFATLSLVASDADALSALVTRVRAQYQAARNLYLEADNYGTLRYSVGAWSRAGDLDSQMAAKLRSMALPGEATDPAERAAEAQAMEGVFQHFDLEAHKSYTTALERAEGHAQADLDVWIRAACEGLRRLKPEDVSRFPRCSP